MEPTNDYILSLEDKTWNYITEEESEDASQACLTEIILKDQKEDDEQDDSILP